MGDVLTFTGRPSVTAALAADGICDIDLLAQIAALTVQLHAWRGLAGDIRRNGRPIECTADGVQKLMTAREAWRRWHIALAERDDLLMTLDGESQVALMEHAAGAFDSVRDCVA